MVLDGGRKPQYLDRTHKTCALDTERRQLEAHSIYLEVGDFITTRKGVPILV